MADAAADAEMKLEGQSGGALQTAKDLFSGAAGGITQVLVGMFLSDLCVCSMEALSKKSRTSCSNWNRSHEITELAASTTIVSYIQIQSVHSIATH